MSCYIYWFPDNTVLVNFACVGRLDLLERILRGRGRWTDVIAFEAQRSGAIYNNLRSIEPAGWLGKPIEVDDAKEQQLIEQIRRAVFGGTADKPLQHLGEATTCHLISTDPKFATSFWITDDRVAAEYARGKGITTRDTRDLVSEGVIDGEISQQEGYELLIQMRALGQNVRVPPRACDL